MVFHRHVDAELLLYFPAAGRLHRFAVLLLAPRKLPEAPKQALVRAALDEEFVAAVVEDETHGDVVVGHWLRLGRDGVVLLRSGLMGAAHVLQRAPVAERRARRAHEGAQLHHRLIEVAGAIGVKQIIGETAQLALGGCRGGVVLHGEDAGEDALDVAVEDRVRLLVGDGEDGGRRVRPHALQVADGLHRLGHLSVVLVHDVLGGLMKVAGPGVEAEALPVLQYRVALGHRKGLDGGKGIQKAGVVVAHRVHTGLLEHDLRDPDAVRIVRLAPGHCSFVVVVPVEQVLVEGASLAVGGGFVFYSHGRGGTFVERSECVSFGGCVSNSVTRHES